jgi:rhodanese-related sulfurtransferase
MSGRGLTANETAGQHCQELLTDLFSSFLVYDLSAVRQQNTPIVVYCAGGEHCTSAIQVLRDLGI